MIPHACDALLPIEQRYASEKFRTLSRHFEPSRLLWAEAVECVAWTQFLGGPEATLPIMLWRRSQLERVHAMLAEPELIKDAAPLLAENYAQARVEDGFAILRSMQDQGRGKFFTLPRPVVMALQEEWHTTGISAAKQGLKHGLTRWQVQWARTPRRKRADGPLHALAFG